MEPIVLYRKDSDPLRTNIELNVCSQIFDTYYYRTDIPPNTLVIGRYSVLPFYEELEYDLGSRGSSLINSYTQHRWISSFDWYYELKDVTPESWNLNDFYKCDYPGPFVVKGETNSKKFQWDELMYAETKRDATLVATKLLNDCLISSQEIFIRKFVPLKVVEKSIRGLPFSKEYRFFCYQDKILSGGYYWSNSQFADDLKFPSQEMYSYAATLTQRVKNFCNFYVLDIAETQQGDLILIEINDGQMSGLSMNSPSSLYRNLKDTL